ncbi:16S rRNA (guanine(966)-N(2))-methyltransferase RsmD [bacterium]|nr:16S rRNA (guanine(966)-N(2))-methyltransferase RsmD [bacterium]
MPKIVGGSARGRIIKQPPGKVRPATARARKSMFDYLAEFIKGARVLDLYCGSGGLGLEALSRGAKGALFVDLSERSISTARDNARMLGFWDQSEFICKDVFRFLRQESRETTLDKFDMIFASPPYKISEPKQLLDQIFESGLLDENGSICLEYSKHTEHPDSKYFTLDRRKIYGETVVDIWDYVQDDNV